MGDEFRTYLKEGSMLERTAPEEIVSFSNKVFVREIRVFCPLWFAALAGASNFENINDEPHKLNTCALASAAVTRNRNNKMSAYHYRMSTILFHSGVKYDDLVRLNRLGVCMSPVSFCRLQEKLGESLKAKVNVWKKDIETNMSAKSLCEEISAKQLTVEVDDMDIENKKVDLTKETLETYEAFSSQAHDEVTARMEAKKRALPLNNGGCHDEFNEHQLKAVLSDLGDEKLPLFK